MRLLLIFLMVIFLIPFVEATSIGVSPSNVIFVDVLRGGYAERTITITTASDEMVLGHIEPAGEMGNWLQFSPNSTNFNVSRTQPYRLKLIIEPPLDTPIGDHTGTLTIVADSTASISGRAGSIVKTASQIRLNSILTGDEIRNCVASSMSFNDVEETFDLDFIYRMQNNGNVRINPEIEIIIWDQLQEDIVHSTTINSNTVLPTTTEVFNINLPNNLDVGQYWVQIEIPECNSESLLTFNVVEKGSIIDKGELVTLNVAPVANKGDTVEVLATFINQGQRVVTAQFKGSVLRRGKLVSVLESDELNVEPGKVAEFSTFFTATKSGDNEVVGRVIYNKKLTFEKSVVINILGGSDFGMLLPLIAYVIIGVSAFFFVRRLKKKKSNF